MSVLYAFFLSLLYFCFFVIYKHKDCEIWFQNLFFFFVWYFRFLMAMDENNFPNWLEKRTIPQCRFFATSLINSFFFQGKFLFLSSLLLSFVFILLLSLKQLLKFLLVTILPLNEILCFFVFLGKNKKICNYTSTSVSSWKIFCY